MRPLIPLTLLLLALLPVAWSAPLIRAGVLPIFGLSEISILSGIVALWETDRFLATVVMFFALIAPVAKLLTLLAVQAGIASARFLAPVEWIGRLAMADIFLVSLYITVVKGVGVGRIETAWGLWLFTFCVLGSLTLSRVTAWRSGRG